ncbi:MAG: hypothetical protein IPO94_03575 [Saprospiraceae bacterium]|nr:hypothetical protein [Saprospiraceae bacterium]
MPGKQIGPIGLMVIVGSVPQSCAQHSWDTEVILPHGPEVQPQLEFPHNH